MTRSLGLLLVCLLSLLTAACFGQAEAAGIGPGSYTSFGITFSAYRSDFGKRTLTGASFYVDANLYRRIGVEVESRSLTHGDDEGINQHDYLIGPRFSILRGRIRPYAKFLAGRGHFGFPFGYAKGSYFVLAPGGGIDWRPGRSRFTVRVIDVEYQTWPGFTYGQLHPFGASTGFSFRVF